MPVSITISQPVSLFLMLFIAVCYVLLLAGILMILASYATYNKNRVLKTEAHIRFMATFEGLTEGDIQKAILLGVDRKWIDDRIAKRKSALDTDSKIFDVKPS